MKVTLDANVLVRAVLLDEPAQARTASRLLREAELIAVPTACLCEFVWVLATTYKLDRSSIAGAIRQLLDSSTVTLDTPAVEAGLAVLDRGGDFADGVIAYEGSTAGGDTFVSFDRKAITRVKAIGIPVQLASALQ